MNKQTFFSHPHVTGFVSFLSRVITGEYSINHSYHDRRLNRKLSFSKLHDALTQYHFAGMALHGNEQQISGIINEFTKANTQLGGYEAASLKTLFWGAGNRAGKLYTSNKAWIDEQPHFEQLIEDALAELQKDAPNFKLFKQQYRMNAGFTKIFAFMSPNDFIIYDSRVAGSLAYLVGLYYDAYHPDDTVDNTLRFHVAPAQGKSNRTKISLQHEFPKLHNRSHMHAKSNVKANWIITQALKLAQQDDCPFVNVREVEAALFMVGYDFPQFIDTRIAA